MFWSVNANALPLAVLTVIMVYQKVVSTVVTPAGLAGPLSVKVVVIAWLLPVMESATVSLGHKTAVPTALKVEKDSSQDVFLALESVVAWV